jgi:predicted nuclease of restriction endonuclease-like (RecB) superfamily
MSKFARTYSESQIMQAPLAQLTWYHHIALMDKIKDNTAALWYAQETVKCGWSRNVLVDQIESGLYERQALSAKTSNYAARLPAPQNELAQQLLKDPYRFDFIDYRDGMVEREIETELVKNVAKLLIEMGAGFAFVGEQYHIQVENEDFYIDLLFYHLKLHCYVVVELKIGDFKPEYAGKLNFYISAVDSMVKTEQDNPTIGILLCKNKRGMIAEYALRDIEKPIGVSEYKLLKKLPKKYEDLLPSAEDIEKRIGMNIDEETISNKHRS